MSRYETKNIRILLADDHRIVREGLKSLLAAGGITVVGEAANGREAVRMVREHGPDVALVDIAMPEMNGIEATLQIVTACPECRVIILSMHATSEYIHQALNAGATGYLLKESAGQEVVLAIKTVARGKRYLARRISGTMADELLSKGMRLKKNGPLKSLSPREREIVQLVV